jgi:hypothetical protein
MANLGVTTPSLGLRPFSFLGWLTRGIRHMAGLSTPTYFPRIKIVVQNSLGIDLQVEKAEDTEA